MTLTQINKAGLDELALDHVFTIGASGTDHYTFQGEGLNGTVNDPTLYLTRGKTYRFENGTGAHPIQIQSVAGAGGSAYSTGVTNNAGSGTVIVEVQHDAPDVLYYQCASHANMKGILYITGALADGGVTEVKLASNSVSNAKLTNSSVDENKLAINSVVTAKIADDAVTNAKIATNAVGSSELADNAVDTAAIADDAVTAAKIANNTITATQLNTDAVDTDALQVNSVTTAKIADDAVTADKLADNTVGTSNIVDQTVTLAKLPHGDGSSNGKFLRANNGADPSFETVTGTTINNNADNRVITGSGTANTLNGESSVVIDANGKLGVGNTNPADFDAYADRLVVGTTSGNNGMTIVAGSSNSSSIYFADGTSGGSQKNAGIVDYNHSTDKMRFATAANDAMVIDTSGNVGIGTTSPSSALDVNGVVEVNNPSLGTDAKLIVKGNDTNNHDIIALYSNASTRGSFAIRTGTSTSPSFLMGTRGSNETLAFMTDGTERARVTDNGITFNGDTAAANALDDYEEGSFTAQFSAAGSLNQTTTSGYYIKVGSMVHVQGEIFWNNNGTGSNSVYVNLPFINRASRGGLAIGLQSGMDVDGDHQLYMMPELDSTVAYLLMSKDNDPAGGHSHIRGDDIRNYASRGFSFGGTYYTNV